jgi:hypothetical protein
MTWDRTDHGVGDPPDEPEPPEDEEDESRFAEELRKGWDAYGEPKRSSATAILFLREAAQKRDAK